QDGEVIIVDDFTGRLMKGRRWSDGLHQAVEAKEAVKIERENQTLATITLQNYFRLYEKLSGMTGTAETEAAEFHSTYKLDVIVIPTHMPMVRKDNPDIIYRTLPEKWDAVVEEIKDLHEKGQPVLVGTVSVENSELIARKLQRIGVPHNVLNAKYHEREAEIVAQAGRKGMVTIATNMAGRGTDILLGGNPDFMAREFLKEQEVDPEEASESQWQGEFLKAKRIVESEHQEVVSLGGLHILGTERHESRRIDNQLRGRSGRQGDPGSSKFYLSLEDDLMRIFASDRIAKLMETFGVQENEPIEHPWLTKAIQGAQERVEGQNFDIRKNLLEYDDVMNQQRKTIYGMRKEVLAAAAGVPLVWFTEDPKTKKKTRHERVVGWKDQEEHLYDLLEDLIIEIVDEAVPRGKSDEFDTKALQVRAREQFNVDMGFEGAAPDKEKLQLDIFNVVEKKLKTKFEALGDDFRLYTQWLYLNT